MKKNLLVITIILCVMSTSTAFARGYSHHNYSGHHGGYRTGHHNDSLGIAFGIAGGLLLGSALMYPAGLPPRTIVHETPYRTYEPEVIVRQPRICVENRIISGEWQESRHDGRRIWVPFQNPITETVQVPCY